MDEPDFKALYLELQKENHRMAQMLEDALAGNNDLQEQMKQLQSKLDRVLLQLEKKKKKDNGGKNERHNPRPAPDQTKNAPLPPKPAPSEEEIGGNPSLEDLVNAGTIDADPVEHKLDPFAAICQECQLETHFLATVVTRQLEHLVGSLRVLEHRQEVRSCNRCKQYVATAEKPLAPIPGSYAAPSLLSFLIVSKFLDGLPLYRIRKIFLRDGVPIPRSTLSDWILSAAFTVEPLYDALKRELFKSKIIKTDDSPLKVQDRKLKGRARKAKVTTYVGDKNHPAIVFDFSPNQSFKKNNDFLKDYVGLVQADGHGGFDALFLGDEPTKIELGCHVHSRRNYFECPDSAVKAVEAILDIYTELYEIENRIANLLPAERLAWRRRCSKPLIKRMHAELMEIKNLKLPPKDPVGDAAEYTLKNWLALTRFLKDADIDLDNNASERAIKDFVLMRKNSLFVGSDDAGKAAVIHLSLVASAKRAGINPVAYLTDVLTRINSLKISELEQLLPWRWPATKIDERKSVVAEQNSMPTLVESKPPP